MTNSNISKLSKFSLLLALISALGILFKSDKFLRMMPRPIDGYLLSASYLFMIFSFPAAICASYDLLKKRSIDKTLSVIALFLSMLSIIFFAMLVVILFLILIGAFGVGPS